MTDDERDQMLRDLRADVEVIRALVATLSVLYIPDDALDLVIETLDVPLVGASEDEGVTNAAIDRMANEIADLRRWKRRLGL